MLLARWKAHSERRGDICGNGLDSSKSTRSGERTVRRRGDIFVFLMLPKGSTSRWETEFEAIVLYLFELARLS
jgi:hypothetical protein